MDVAVVSRSFSTRRRNGLGRFSSSARSYRGVAGTGSVFALAGADVSGRACPTRLAGAVLLIADSDADEGSCGRPLAVRIDGLRSLVGGASDAPETPATVAALVWLGRDDADDFTIEVLIFVLRFATTSGDSCT